MLRFSCADYTFPVLERSAALRLIKLLGINHVDIGLFARSSHFSPMELQVSPKKYTAQLLLELDATELLVSDVFVQIGVHPSECAANDPSPVVREKNRDVFARALEFCIALGCDHLTGLPGVFHAEVSRDRDLELATEEAVRRVNECASAGVRYAIEPHLESICEDVDSTRAFLDASEWLTLTLDYGHFITSGETSQQVHTLLRFASHVHVRGGAKERLQTSVDENVIDFPGMLAGLQELGYGGFLALEYVWVDWKGCNRSDNVSETLLLRRALESAASKIATVRTNHV
jgi:sugar phosphate isomerase/epimerase